MKINQISSYSQVNSTYRKQNVKNQIMQRPALLREDTESVSSGNVNFKGTNVGGYTGIILGGAAAVALAFTVAPVLICTGPLLGGLGLLAGEQIQKDITGEVDE